MNQLSFPSVVTLQEISREKSLGGAIGLCIKAAGYEPKQVIDDLKMDKAQWSRWESGQEGVIWPKLKSVMDKCGNDAPVLWMNYDRGYDLSSIRRTETETERALRMERERSSKLQERLRYAEELLQGRRG
ncbi:MAG: hypothetical protein LBI48_02095 [Burkholderiaceae bacterium]|nr:hypothetical protein [Burkholderiaceae bacterium]